MRQTMAAVMMTATTAVMGCGPSVVVQGFGAVEAPACTVNDGSPSLSRGVLDLGAAQRYQAFLRARTARDSTLVIQEAEVSWRLVLSSAQAEVVGVAASTIGIGGVACSGAEGCRSELPSLSPVVTTELGLIEDERILLMSTDLVTTPVGEGLATLLTYARDLDPALDFDSVEAVLDVVLVDSSGGRSLPSTFVLELCEGCLAPDRAFCAALGATSVSLGTQTCTIGQDVATSTCVCADGRAAPDEGCGS